MSTVISSDNLKAAQAFHGNVCLGLPLGLRAGQEALQALNVSRAKDKELVTIVELAPEQFSHCFVDGIQWVTGCTTGKNNLQVQPMGKFAATVVDVSRHIAVRVSYRADFLKEFLNWPPVAAKWTHQMDFHPQPGEVNDDIQAVLTRPVAELFTLQFFENYPYLSPVMDWSHEVCSDCGELVIGSYTHSLAGAVLCPACWSHRVYAQVEEGKD